MKIEDMESKREKALNCLQEAINNIGPISDETKVSIREPILDIVDSIYNLGEELKEIDFEIYNERSD